MTETYVNLGWGADWHFYTPLGLVVAAFPFFFRAVARRAGKPTNPTMWAVLGWGVWMIIGSLAGMPQGWMMIGMPLAYAVSMLFPTTTIPGWYRLLAIPVFIFIAWCMAKIGTNRQTIVLGPNSGEYSEAWRSSPMTLTRDGLTVRALHNVDNDPPGRYGWIVERNEALGLHFDSKDIFWGPHGMVKGNQLGNHIADWARVKPIYENYSL